MALQGASGSGKTYGALLLAFGLCGDWSKIAIIDSENHSSELYAHLGRYQVLHIEPPFTPERYVEAIKVCEQADIEVIVIDSISHEWVGIGGILDAHSNMPGNSYTNWAKLTPRHNSFVQHMLQSPIHIIGTIRSKQEYVLSEKNGKQVPEKVGMKGVTRSGMDYEFTLVFNLDMRNNAIATKDRTSIFSGKSEFKVNSEIGKMILDWCNEGIPTAELGQGELLERINGCKSLPELLELYYANPKQKQKLKSAFTKRKADLEANQADSLINNSN
ncbi:AAA family ATPase [Flavobacterium sp.]|uniref:AAA family ATPase n=1 Tax=Flavobacterium sp. TaxID=239 RepID=UPI003BF56F57